VHAREDGTKIRKAQLSQRGTCGWAPQLQLPRAVDATFGAVTAPMVREDDYVWAPDSDIDYGAQGGTACNPNWAANHGTADAGNQNCGYVDFGLSCAGPGEITLEFEVTAVCHPSARTLVAASRGVRSNRLAILHIFAELLPFRKLDSVERGGGGGGRWPRRATKSGSGWTTTKTR
jgi:hypothetical protein